MTRDLVWWLLRRSKSLRQVKRLVKREFLDRPRRIPRALGVAGLLSALDADGCRYVVLRWFDDLPQIHPDGDLDILVHDDDAAFIDRILTRSPRTGDIQCDVYSVHGLPSFAHRRFPYYPPPIAKQILARSVRHESGAYVPCEEDHFYSLAFHALYHRGYSSGLPVSDIEGPKANGGRHDYARVLRDLASQLRLSVPITMEALDRELDRMGWRPPPDTLMKWAVTNSWCTKLVGELMQDVPTPAGLMVYLVREAASDPESVAAIEQMMDEWGFKHLLTKALDGGEKDRASRLVRGGNWGRGSYPRSGGEPAVVIVAIDPSPSMPAPALLARHPGVDNGRIFDFKKEARDWWNTQQPAGRRCSIMHSSDSAAHGVHYLQVIMPNEVEGILKRRFNASSARTESQVA